MRVLPPQTAELCVPLYFFNTHSRSSNLDTSGTDLPGLDEARHIAICYAGEIFRDDAKDLALEEDWRLEVLDEAGATVFDIQVHLRAPTADAADLS